MESIEDTSYSFEQGQRLESEIFGETLVIGGDTPLVHGQVDGDKSFITMEVGALFASLFESFADEAPIPEEMLAEIDDNEMRIWICLLYTSPSPRD